MLSKKETVSTTEASDAFENWIGKRVMFKREKLCRDFVYNYGTMAIDSLFIVSDINTSSNVTEAILSIPSFPCKIQARLSDLSVVDTEELDYDTMVKPFKWLIDEGLSGPVENTRQNLESNSGANL